MSLAYKPIWIRTSKACRLLLLLPIVLLTFPVWGQNVSSPYSILGIGEIDMKNAGRYFISGSSAVSRRDPWAYNISNPASLTALPLKTMHFDVLMRGKASSFSFPKDDTATAPSKDFILRRISMALKVSQNTGIAFGLQPYSSVNYKLTQKRVLVDDNTYYDKAVEGSGGINLVYFSIGRTLGKKVSFGITSSYLFGSLQESVEYHSSYMNIDRKQIDFYHGAVFQGGLQYNSTPGKQWQHFIGITGSAGTHLTGELKTEYLENSVVIDKTVRSGSYFELPLSVAMGYSATKQNGITLSAEGGYSKWNYQKVNYASSYTYPTYSGSLGLEYSIKHPQNRFLEKGFLGIGLHAENSYIRIQKQKLWDYSVSFGGGVTATRNISVYSGIELGTKGNKTNNQIKEKYTQFIVGLTLKDIWIGTKKYGRYND